MEMILQIIVSGLATGGVYGLIALGFVLIYKATSVLNLAMGDFMTLGAFICLTVLEKFQAPFYVAFLVTLLCAFVIGVAVERVILRPLIGEPVISVIMVTIGLGVVLQGDHVHGLDPRLSQLSGDFPPPTAQPGFGDRPLRSALGVYLCRHRDLCLSFHL